MVASDSQRGVQVNTTLLTGGAVLAMIGSILFGIGVLLGGTAFLSAVRQWIRQMEKSPGETAKRKFRQLRVAASEGAKAWQSGVPGG